MTLLSSARQSRSLGAVFSRSERNSSTERSTRLTMSVPRVALSMAPTVPNPAHTRKNYRSHDQVAVALESSVAIVWCRGWISTPVLARREGILVHALCAMSTHIHLVVTDVHGRLPIFLHSFHRLVARCMQVYRNWDDVVWDKDPPSVVELGTPAAVVEKIAYVLANPVAAGLVERAHQWPGAKVNMDQLGRGTLRASRPRYYLDPKNPAWPDEAG